MEGVKRRSGRSWGGLTGKNLLSGPLVWYGGVNFGCRRNTIVLTDDEDLNRERLLKFARPRYNTNHTLNFNEYKKVGRVFIVDKFERKFFREETENRE